LELLFPIPDVYFHERDRGGFGRGEGVYVRGIDFAALGEDEAKSCKADA
jgi:hypothetical protein